MSLPIHTLRELIAPYGLDAEDLEFISVSQNYVFRACRKSKRIIVRISTGRHRTLEQIEAELKWIQLLVNHGMKACLPVPSLSGHLCHEAVIEDIPYLVTCFTHAEGRLLTSKDSTLAEFEKIGQTTGELHSVSAKGLEHSIKRPNWFDSRLLHEDFHECREFITEEFRESVTELIEELKTTPITNQTYGLIHGDLNFGNLYISGGEIELIDFDNCEYGYYAQDLSVILYDAMYFKALRDPNKDLTQTMKTYWDAFMKGYCQLAPIKEIDGELLEKFFLLREAILCVYFYRTFSEEQMDADFIKVQKLKEQNLINRTHQVDFRRLLGHEQKKI